MTNHNPTHTDTSAEQLQVVMRFAMDARSIAVHGEWTAYPVIVVMRFAMDARSIECPMLFVARPSNGLLISSHNPTEALGLSIMAAVEAARNLFLSKEDAAKIISEAMIEAIHNAYE